MSYSAETFAVVVPIYDEEPGMGASLAALAAQTDTDFTLYLVDNGSTDDSRAVARRFAETASMPTHVIDEPQKGTGAAADTGFRAAIAAGATHIARTDADCLPAPDWIAELKRGFDDGLEFIAGKIVARDDPPLTRVERVLLPALVALAERAGRLHRRGPQFHYPYILVAGNNLATTAALYERAGGFPRVAFEDQHEDRALAEAVRTLTDRGAVRRECVVANSIRRVRAYGYVGVLRWYHDHSFRGPGVDIR